MLNCRISQVLCCPLPPPSIPASQQPLWLLLQLPWNIATPPPPPPFVTQLHNSCCSEALPARLPHPPFGTSIITLLSLLLLPRRR